MKILFALWLAILMATSNVINQAHAADKPEILLSPHYKQALRNVPQGADITEIISTRATLTRWGVQPIYIKFDFDSQCYLGYAARGGFALTAISCE